MPQITNLTIGPVVTVAATADVVYRAVPAPQGAVAKVFESSNAGTPELATRINASTKRRQDFSQSSMLRVNAPIVRSINGENTRVDSNIIELNAVFAKTATPQEKEAALNLMIKALKHAFFTSVLIDGESMN